MEHLEIGNKQKHNKYDNKPNHLLISGYLRAINHTIQYNFNHLHCIVLLFYGIGGYATYFAESIDPDYKSQMKFGDVVKISNEYFVMNIRNEIVKVSNTKVDKIYRNQTTTIIRLPKTICNHLYNTVEFYSKIILEIKSMIIFRVRCDDGFICKHFGEALNREYKYISVRYSKSKFDWVIINFGNGYTKFFDPLNNSITSKDIENFFEIRKDKQNLTKIKAVIPRPRNHMIHETGVCPIYSVRWERKSPEYTSGYHDSTAYVNQWMIIKTTIEYIGPNSEKKQMVDRLKQFYHGSDGTPEVKISYSAITDDDWFKTQS